MSIPATARDLMSRDIVTLDGSETLEDLEQAMRVLRFRHMPVTDGRKLIGLLSHRDLLRVSASSLLPHKHKQDHFLAQLVRVADIMTRDVVTAAPDDALADIAAQMISGKLGCMPIVESDGTLVGVITEADFVRLAQTYLPR